MITVSPICTDVELLGVISIFKKLITLGCIVVPVILVIFLMVDIVKTISSSDVDTKKLFKSISKRLVAGVFVFLIPAIINFALSIIPMETLYYVDCYNNATDENILYIAENNAITNMNSLNSALLSGDYNTAYLAYEEARVSIKKIPNKEIREQKEAILKSTKVKLDSLKGGSIDISSTEGDYLTNSSASKYNYEYIKNNLKKYKGLSEDRKDIVLTAASYAGKIPYYWGGSASSKNFSANKFGTTVTADSGGRTKKGLDCSHFVDFVFWQVMNDNLGNSNTTYIWNYKSTSISESQLLPGDVGFINDPSVGSNHIGIYAGTDAKGNKIWIHLAGSPNNNVIINNINLPYYRRINILK